MEVQVLIIAAFFALLMLSLVVAWALSIGVVALLSLSLGRPVNQSIKPLLEDW